MPLSALALLDLVDNAIVALTTGGHSSYSIGARSVTKLDLATLFVERRMLQREAERESRSGAFSLAKMGRTSR